VSLKWFKHRQFYATNVNSHTEKTDSQVISLYQQESCQQRALCQCLVLTNHSNFHLVQYIINCFSDYLYKD